LAVVESMTGARLVHDTLEREGWSVEIADAQKVKGLAPLACKTDKTDSLVLATLSQHDVVPAIWLPDPTVREERELARQAEVAYQRTVADWQANKGKKGAGATPGRASRGPSSGQAARQGSAPGPAL
jgi:hypothetical protein